MTTPETSEGRSQNEFWSVDSAPRKFAAKVEQTRAPKVLVTFLIVSTALLWLVNGSNLLNGIFRHGDLIFAPADGYHAVPLRIFCVSFLFAFALFTEKEWGKTLGLIFDMVATYAFFCALIDAVTVALWLVLDVTLSLHVLEITSGILGFAVFSYKLLERGSMPSRIDLDIHTQGMTGLVLRMLLVAAFAGFVAVYVTYLDLEIIKTLREFAFLGGIGPGVFLFLPVFFLSLYTIARLEQLAFPKAEFAPPLTFIVPAHNEEYIIARTIEAMDKAAGNYDGRVNILIMNNNSVDATKEIAQATLAACKHATGRVIDEPRPGKSHALNSGLDAVDTEFFVRVDADTQIMPDSIKRAMKYFSDPKVGVVGGLPLPPMGAMFDRARFLEVMTKHGFYSVGMGAINAVVGIPGMLSIYRTELPRRLGGFVEGMNGEDSDISMRVAEMGYKLVVDPKVKYISEVPASYKHMREQRMRWFRSTFHLSSRCRDLIYGNHFTIRGKLILPYMLINSARRAMMVPLILFGALCLALPFGSTGSLHWQAVIAVMVGAPTIVAVFATLVNGYPKGILYLPEYLTFRIIRAYFTLESMLSISIKDYGEHPYSAKALARPRPSSNRIA